MKYEIVPDPNGEGFDVVAWSVKFDGSTGHKRLLGHCATPEAAQAAIEGVR